MLVLSRKVNETIDIGGGVSVTVTRISGNRVTLGITAPANIKILRSELEPHTASRHTSSQPHTPQG